MSRLTSLYFILVLAFVFLQATTFGLFIAEFGSKSLPYAYLSISVLASLVAFLYLRLSERVPFNRLLVLNLGFLALMCTVFRLGLATPLRRSFIFLLPFWFQTLINLVNLVVWPLAGRTFDLRQAKRLYTLIGSGSWLANVLGGFVIAPLVGRIGADNLLLLSVVLIVPSLFLLRTILRSSLEQSEPETRPSRPADTSRPKTQASPLRDPYIRLIFAYFLLFWLSFYFVDNIFYDRAGAQFPDAPQLAGFIGQLLSVTGILGFISSTFLTGRIISRYGLRVGLLLMPVFVIVNIAAAALVGTLTPGSPVLFWLVSSAKMLNLALGFSLSQSTSTLLYQPLPASQRGRTQTMAEGIVQPFAIGLAGLALLLFNTLLGLGAVGLSTIFLVIAVGWIVTILLLARQYARALSQAIAKREWGQSTIGSLDLDCWDNLLQNIQSPHAGVVIYSLNMLEQGEPPAWEKVLSGNLPLLLAHPAAEVRQDALRRVEKSGLSAAAGEVTRHLGVEQESEVKAAALRALAAIGESKSLDLLVRSLDEPDQDVRRGALVGLLKYGGIDGALAAGRTFNDLVHSPDPLHRRMAASVLGEVEVSHFYQPAMLLLRDRDPEVKRAALKAAAKIRNPRLWQVIVEESGSLETGPDAVLALAAGGEAVLSHIEAVVSSASSPAASPLAGRKRRRLLNLIRTCGRIPSQRSIDLLLTQIGVPDNQIRTQVLESLSACGFHTSPADTTVTDRIPPEIDLAAMLVAVIDDFNSANGEDVAGLLLSALEGTVQKARDRILLLLSFSYDSEAILRAKDAFASGTPSQQAYALEVIDTQLPGSLKKLVMPLVEDVPLKERLENWAAAGVQPQRQSEGATLEGIITGQPGLTDDTDAPLPEAVQFSPWMRACALLAIGSHKAANADHIVRVSQSSPEPLIREAALWSMNRLRSTESQGDNQMLSTFEKVIILKTASIFSQTPDEILGDVAVLMEEIEFSENETVFAQGDRGDSLYIVVSGKLGAYDGERLLNYLNEGDVFGEMALLDPASRLATITALESTRLLRLERQHFIQLLAARPEIASGIIIVLTRRLRDRVHDLTQLDAQLKELEGR